ncbi:MAG: hypothetical protein LBI43_01070 [Streptococcaceae bacterium]|nr:hypothetical protein [Streptococcaceae bacterium]
MATPCFLAQPRDSVCLTQRVKVATQETKFPHSYQVNEWGAMLLSDTSFACFIRYLEAGWDLFHKSLSTTLDESSKQAKAKRFLRLDLARSAP